MIRLKKDRESVSMLGYTELFVALFMEWVLHSSSGFRLNGTSQLSCHRLLPLARLPVTGNLLLLTDDDAPRTRQ